MNQTGVAFICYRVWIRDVFCAQHLRVLGYKTHLNSRALGAILKRRERYYYV